MRRFDVLCLTVLLSARSAHSLFNCNAPGINCQNAGQCRRSSGTCVCSPAYREDDCSVDIAKTRSASCDDIDCGSSGFCQGDNSQASCTCSPTHYGDGCRRKRLDAKCSPSDMIILINPYPGFRGVMHVKDKGEITTCRLSEIPNSVERREGPPIPSGAEGFVLRLPTNGSECGDAEIRQEAETGRITHVRHIQISYMSGGWTKEIDEVDFICRFLPGSFRAETRLIRVDLEDPPTTTPRQDGCMTKCSLLLLLAAWSTVVIVRRHYC